MQGRLLTGNFQTSRKAVWKEDSEFTGPFFQFFKTVLCAYGPTIATIERWTGCVNNAAENEPYFLAVALAYAKSGLDIPSWATGAVWTYVAARYAHVSASSCASLTILEGSASSISRGAKSLSLSALLPTPSRSRRCCSLPLRRFLDDLSLSPCLPLSREETKPTMQGTTATKAIAERQEQNLPMAWRVVGKPTPP